jgi:hypothetical protein
MKNFIISFEKIVLIFLANCFLASTIMSFSGCCENNITDPVTTVDKEQLGTTDTYFQGIIRLDGVLDDPYPIGNSFYRIFGQIKYEQQNILYDPALISFTRFANVHLVANAELQYVCTVCSPSPEDELSGFLSEVSDDRVALAGNSVSLLEKTYTILGREDGMMLKFKFAVTFNGVELCAMWLALPETDVIATVKTN